MHQATQEELRQRAQLNDIASDESDANSDQSEDQFQDNYHLQINNYDQMGYMPYPNDIVNDKNTEINMRERVSTVELRHEVNQVNVHIRENHLQNRSVPNPIKLLVSKQKRRYSLNGFNLDLTYITEKIIAMGFPAENIESIYRNSMQDVERFFEVVHPGHHRIYNLCEERKYAHTHFNNNVAEFPFQDHQAPTFPMIYDFCIDLEIWLKAHDKNVAGIHCKAGKGRTGVMICCYMLYAKQFNNAYDSMRYYGFIRTKNTKGVTIPSQIRYIFYFEKALNNKWLPDLMPNKEVEIVKVRMIPVPNLNIFGGCQPWFRIQNRENEFSSKSQIKVKDYKVEPYAEFNLQGIYAKGDALIQFFNNGMFKNNEKIFQAWFNCDFFDHTGVLMIDKFMLDKACKDKAHNKFPKDFRIEIHAVEVSQNRDSKPVLTENNNGKLYLSTSKFGF